MFYNDISAQYSSEIPYLCSTKNKMENFRRRNQLPLKAAIDLLLSQYGLKTQYKNAQIAAHWERLMGAAIARQTRSVRVLDGVLFLRIESASLRQELVYAKEKIIQLVNEDLQENYLTDVVFR